MKPYIASMTDDRLAQVTRRWSRAILRDWYSDKPASRDQLHRALLAGVREQKRRRDGSDRRAA